MQSGERQEFAWRTGGEPLELSEYIVFARERSLSVTLELSLGPIEIGCIALNSGQLWHAEMPGSSGNTALSFMSKLARVEIGVAALRRDQRRTLNGSSEQLVSAPQLSHRSRKALTAAYAGFMHGAVVKPTKSAAQAAASDPESAATDATLRLPTIIREPASSPVSAAQRSPNPPTRAPARAPVKPEPRGTQEDFDSLFLRAMRAYGRRDYRVAMESFKRCATLRPDDSRVQHNIDRLRERLGES